MASLLERMNIPANTTATGPVRSRTPRGGSSPYNRANRPPKGDVDSAWSHDLFEDPAAPKSKVPSLSERLNGRPVAPRANVDFSIAQKALRDATGGSGAASSSAAAELSIKGASTSANVVEVTGLADGTTAEDVAAIFKRCGAITAAKSIRSAPRTEGVTIRVTFKAPASANAAVQKFHNQPADGKTLSVRIVGGASTSLGGRLGGVDGLGLVREEGSVDVLMDGGEDGVGSKMRSDSLLHADPRAHILLSPPGVETEVAHTPTPTGPRNRGRGGRGGRRGGQRGANHNNSGRMEVDR